MRYVSDAVYVSLAYGLVIVAMGCAAPTGDELQPFVAVAGAYGVSGSGSPAPAPEPESDKCDSCRGTGKSDGRVTCPVCGGTGKKTTKVLVHPVSQPCNTGTCSTLRTVR